MNAAVLVRVRWVDSAGAYQAHTMQAVKDRHLASSTSSAEYAAKAAAAKFFFSATLAKGEAVNTESVALISACKPGTNITAVDKEWAAFEFALKGSTTQTELCMEGGAN